MKITTVLIPLFILFLCFNAHAHTLYFTLSDDGDNMVELEGMFSNGVMGAGIAVNLYSKEDNALIWKGRTDEFGICTFERPDKPYEVELDAGPGHQSREDGI